MVRLTNCLIGEESNGVVDIYAPKSSTVISLPKKHLDRFLNLGLRKQTAASEVIKTAGVLEKILRIIGVKGKIEKLLEFLLQYGILVEEESAPSWDKMPQHEYITPIDVLLVVASYPYAGDVATPPPFGAMLIASALRNKGVSVAIVDMALERMESWRIVPLLRQYQPQIVGISAITAAGCEAEKVAHWIKQWAKKEQPKFKGIVLGGHHATDFTEQVLGSGCFDVVVSGKQAFLIAPQIFTALLNKETMPADIPGVHWNIDGKPISGQPLQWNRDAKIPTPAWDMIEIKRYSTPGATFWGIGCPFSCTYCSLGGVSKIYRPLSEVKNEWLAATKAGCETLALLDDEIFHDRKLTEKLVAMIERELLFRDKKICLQSRVDTVEARYRDGLLGLLRKAVRSLYLEMGMDGLTETDIKNVRKAGAVDLQSPFRVMKIAKKLDIEIGFGSILGFPWNTKEELRKQSHYVRSILQRAEELRVEVTVMGGAFTPFPGSALGRQIIKGEMRGVRVVNMKPEWFDFHRPNIDTPFWDHKYLEKFLVKHFKKLIEIETEGGV